MNIQGAISRGFCCALACTGLLSTPSLHAQAAMQSALAPLNYFVGDWNCTGHFSNGKPVESGDSVSRELEGHWMRIRHTETPPNRWAAEEWWGYDKVSTHFIIILFDNFGNVRHYVSTGWSGNSLTLENTAAGGFIDHFVYERQGDVAYRVVYTYRNGDGVWRVGDEQVCTRERQAPES